MQADDGPKLEAFTGHWDLARHIDDHHMGQKGVFNGGATFQAAQSGLRYHETGQMQHGTGPVMTSERCYLWRSSPKGIAVLFEDARAFHMITPGVRPKDMHDCPPDQYSVAYDFSAWPVWTSVWCVKGPRKDYTMTSTYCRPA